MPELDLLVAMRIVATPRSLDHAEWPDGSIPLRLAPDEVLLVGADFAPPLEDPHAIAEPESGFAGVWLAADEAEEWLSRSCEWRLPAERPAFVQGMVAGLATKLWFEDDRVLVAVPAPFAVDLQERMG